MVSFEISETSQKELGIGKTRVLPTPVPKIVDYIKKGQLSLTEGGIIATGNLPASATVENFKKVAFTDKQIDEAQVFLEAAAGKVLGNFRSNFFSPTKSTKPVPG